MRAPTWAVALACIGVALVLGVIAPFAAGPAPSFARQMSYRAGVSPSSVAIADLNGDGKPELVTADYGEPSRASVFLNRGDGRFQAKRDHVTGPQPISLAIGDLNGELFAIYVDPDHWGTRVGRALIAAGEQRLRELGLTDVILWVLEDNPRARRFYEQAGWHADGTSRPITFRGIEVPEVRYRKRLGTFTAS